MIEVAFDQYHYFPALRTRQAELKGLKELTIARKRQLLPIMTVYKWPKAADFSKSAEKAAEVMDGLPYILDLTSDARQIAEQQNLLRDPTNAFEAWRNFVSKSTNAIPVVQLAAEAKTRDVVKQAQEFERQAGKIAFRIRDFTVDTTMVVNALSALNDPRNAIVFVDCQYIRNALSAYVAAAIATINRLRTEFPDLVISVLSTSFPQSVTQFGQRQGSINIAERELHQQIGGDGVAAYGDHASIHSVVYDEELMMLRWAPRIDFPREFEWYFERRPGELPMDGYISAARAVRESEPDLGRLETWGEQQIILASEGNPPWKAPGQWIAVRVNIHIARQLDLSNRMAKLAQGGDDDLDEGDENF